MFSKVLIANRGEIALRILRACKELGIATVAVHSQADANAMHVRLADESVCIGPNPARDSYLNIPSILAACEITGADAVHPGYGFLSENARFAQILAEHKITFIGPSAHHIEIMGDKITAKKTAVELGIPVVPGSAGEVTTAADAQALAKDIGYPVLVKATAGGGGRGMKVARNDEEMAIALSTARTEAKAAFGNDSVYIEKYLEKPRHIEVQVMGDGKGNAVHLGTRDCSLQRRHQKVWEEATAPTVPEAQRDEIGEVCAAAMRKLKYSGAGTIEFLYENGEFYFIEMNTRLQVEHPVTERVTNIDIVYEQIRVASGETLSIKQDEVRFVGHAIEVRINAEDPQTFAPSPGKIAFYHPAGGFGVRVDSAVYQGYVIPPYYDSLIGKLIVHGRTRAECLQRLSRAIDEFVVDGVKTTLPLFQRLIKEPDIIAGDYDIHWLEKFFGGEQGVTPETPFGLAVLVGLELTIARRAADLRNFGFGPVHTTKGWRGKVGVIGQHALHIQCPWRLDGPAGIVTGSSDLYTYAGAQPEPEGWTYDDGNSLDQLRLDEIFGPQIPLGDAFHYRSGTKVTNVAADPMLGDLAISLSNLHVLRVFPNGSDGEEWRFFNPGDDDSAHFVFPSEGR